MPGTLSSRRSSLADFRRHNAGTRDSLREQQLAKENFENNLPAWVRDGREHEVTFDAGSITVVHGLNRVPQGWFVHSMKGDAHAICELSRDDEKLTLINNYVGSLSTTGK